MTAFIETQFPVARLSDESNKERKAGAGQILTRLGKWWGRKPLILVRAAILGMLMPASAGAKALLKRGKIIGSAKRPVSSQVFELITDIYNLLHARELSPELVAKVSKKPADVTRAGFESLLELRRLHVALDVAVRDAYGWADLDLGHDLVEVESLPENDRARYTISPAARKEVLKRLLALNHQRAKEEAAKVPLAKAKGGKKSAARLDLNQPDLI